MPTSLSIMDLYSQSRVSSRGRLIRFRLSNHNLPIEEPDVAPWYDRFAHGAMGRRIDPKWGGPIELFLVPASAPRLV